MVLSDLMTIKGTSADMTQFKKEQQELQWLCQNQSKLQPATANCNLQ